MPKYLPTIDIEPRGIETALRAGNLRLQPGQWIRCGGGNPSRFSHATSTTIYAVHPEGPMGTGKIPKGKLAVIRQLAAEQKRTKK